ncbi:MAG: RnfABCDGE type electron transport complex subunit D [Magnetococcales bacterium]|nr:RnfABCDGE type electron transport complex subunit D [Magnetococcales bacterium]
MSQTNLLLSSSPHVHGGDSVSRVMQTVIWALMPATAMAVMVFGWPALLVILITVASCVVTESLFVKLRRRPSTLGDRSAALTGLLLALTLPPHTPWWVCVSGGVFAILVAKQVYGGLGFNMFNPALAARVFLLISFPVQLTAWPVVNPLFGEHAYSLSDSIAIIMTGHQGGAELVDAVTAATPLGQYRTETGLGKTVQEALGGQFGFDELQAAGGLVGGSLGETSALLLLAGGLYMLRKKLITWHIPVTMLVGCLLPATFFWVYDSAHYPDPIFHLVTGGLVIGAFFMATDMVTSPVSIKGQVIFGLGCGLLTFLIRTWSGYPEGVSFAVLLMNAVVPLIDQYTRPAIYGQQSIKS